jgi:predicted transport protein
MPLFQVQSENFQSIAQSDFDSEKRLQQLIERNLAATFNCRFVASEVSTGEIHRGRIDTLALSEENNPVIIEYKKLRSPELFTQSFFYLGWLRDHKGDFEVLVRKALGDAVQIDWSDIRVICLARDYSKYERVAIREMGGNIELWQYRLFANSCFYLEEVHRRSRAISTETEGKSLEGKNPVMVAAGKKAAETRATGTYTYRERVEGKPQKIIDMAQQIREFIASLDTAIEEVPKKFYIAYKTTQNIVCMEPQKQQVVLYLKLDPKAIVNPSSIIRDVSHIGHFGTGDTEVTIRTEDDVAVAQKLIEQAYKNVGG